MQCPVSHLSSGGNGKKKEDFHSSYRRSKRRIVSPSTRGLLLVFVFILWGCISYFGPRGKPEDGHDTPKVPLHQLPPSWHSRVLLQTNLSDVGSTKGPVTLSDAEMDGLDLTPEQKEERWEGKCIPPAIEQFPQPMMHNTVRKHGGVIIHVFVAIYMFIGLAIVCDDYFVPALDRIAEVLNMPPDVAGATFMAAGSSAPELATAVIGVFVAKDDIGVSGVIGSAVFNITLVIAVCALAAEHVFYLNWYSVVRDCTSYLLCIVVLLCTICNEIVSWPEALVFLILYVLYCVAMAFNSKFEGWAQAHLPVPASWKAVHQGGVDVEDGTTYKTMQHKQQNGSGSLPMEPTDPTSPIPLTPVQENPVVVKEEKEDDPFTKPVGKGKFAGCKWAFMLPLYYLCAYTIPDCRKEAWANAYVATFLTAIVWISIYSYMMVWMITVIGFTWGIPDTVMGLTFIAAGVSVPDALSGIAVVKEGHGDMAVSNAIGSNVFDILICLGLPWFLDTAIVNPGTYVRVQSKGLLYSTFSLFSTVVFLIVACHCNSWKLDKKFGIVLLIWYFIFMIFASMYELNIFGEFNPPECDSDF